MKSKLKKTLSLLLALVMCLSVMSVGAFAQGETSYTVTFQMTDSVGRLLLVDVDANYSAGNPYTNVSGTWYNGQYNENTRVAFTQTVTSGGFATKPTDTPYYGYGMPQPNNGDPKQFTADDSHAYTFDGWATEDGKLYDFTKPVTADLTLHPRFSTTGATITISNEDELLNFAEEVRRGRRFNGHGIQQTVQLSSDITLTNNETPNWTPISDTTFQGNFDGNNHSISGLYVTGTYEKVGFFKVLTSSNTVSNLTLIAPKVSSTSSYVGALAGEMNATTVTNCHVTGAMDIRGLNNVGGLFGHVTNGANIVNCTVDGSNSAVIAATENTASEQGRMVGGLIGNTDGTVVITNCSVSGVTAQGWRKIGGLIGQAAKITATNVSVSDVTLHSNADTSFASHLTMGGLVGIFANIYTNSSISGTVSNVTMTGPANIAEGKNYIMGLVSGGTGEARETAETNMTKAGMTFNVTVSGTNTRDIETVSNYAGIMGTVAQTTTYVGYVKSLGANVGNTIYLNVKMVFPHAQDGMRLKYQIGNLAPTYFSLPTPDADGVYLFQIPVIAKYFGVQGTISLVDSNDETVYYISKGVNGEHVTSVQYSVYDYLDLLEASSIRDTWLDLSTAIRNLGNMTAKHWTDSHNGDMANRGWIAYPAAN